MAYRVGVACARAGALAQASRIQELARQGGIADDRAALSDADRRQEEILLARGDITRAVQLLEKAHGENHPPLSILTRESLARPYAKTSQLDQAITACESLLSLPGGNPLGWEPQQPWMVSALRRRRTCQGGWTGRNSKPRPMVQENRGAWGDLETR